MKTRFKKNLLSILETDVLFRNGTNKNQKFVFENVLNSDQIVIFSNPQKATDLDSIQSEELILIKLMNHLKFIKKNDAKIRKGIDESYTKELVYYTESNYDDLIQLFEEKLKDNVSNY
jgi:hypothetical protein